MSEPSDLKRLAGIGEFKGYEPYGGIDNSISGSDALSQHNKKLI